MTITLKKESIIRFERGSEHQCKDVNYPEFQYTVTITMPCVLDDRGFSIDQTEVHNRVVTYFKGKAALSCEVMATGIIFVVQRLADELRIKIINLSVKIQAAPANEKTTITINK